MSDVGPPGWFPDPYGRYEVRYFNGQRWTGDVSMGGRHFVDPQGAGNWTPSGPSSSPQGGRGVAIAAFVVGLCAAATAWMPLVFVASAIAAIVGFALGIAGLRKARRQGGYGKDLAVWGVVLSVAAVPLCVAGFFFTRYVVQQIDRYDDPGQFTLDPGACSIKNGIAQFSGTIANDEDSIRSYELTVTFSTGLAELSRQYVDVKDVAPDETRDWSASDVLSTSLTNVDCDVVAVHGPLPFGVRPQE